MAILKNVEIHYAHLDPERPNKKYNPKNPTWELQLRTKDPAVKAEWASLNMNFKPVMDKDNETVFSHWRCNLKKQSFKADGSKAAPVQVVNGKGQDVDPNTIGNGSIANIRIFQHEYEFEGKKGIKSILMAVQLVRHIVYVPKPMEDFDEANTETIAPAEGETATEQPAGKPAGAEEPVF